MSYEEPLGRERADMTEERRLIRNPPNDYDDPEVIGYIEVDDDLDVSWDLADDNPAYPELRKVAHEHDTGRVSVRGRREPQNREGGWGEIVNDPTPEDYIDSILSEFNLGYGGEFTVHPDDTPPSKYDIEKDV